MAKNMKKPNDAPPRERTLGELKMKNSSPEYPDDRAAAFYESSAEHRVACGIQRYDQITK